MILGVSKDKEMIEKAKKGKIIEKGRGQSHSAIRKAKIIGRAANLLAILVPTVLLRGSNTSSVPFNSEYGI